jgi:hypothetical protein
VGDETAVTGEEQTSNSQLSPPPLLSSSSSNFSSLSLSPHLLSLVGVLALPLTRWSTYERTAAPAARKRRPTLVFLSHASRFVSVDCWRCYCSLRRGTTSASVSEDGAGEQETGRDVVRRFQPFYHLFLTASPPVSLCRYHISRSFTLTRHSCNPPTVSSPSHRHLFPLSSRLFPHRPPPTRLLLSQSGCRHCSL